MLELVLIIYGTNLGRIRLFLYHAKGTANMKRTISLLLAVLLIMSMGTTAYAGQSAVIIVDDSSESAAEPTATPEPTAAPEVTATPAPAETEEPHTAVQRRAVIGANLDESQIAAVYSLFGVKRGDVPELIITNAEEREYLEGYVDDSIIGTRSISCVYVELLESGKGMDVKTSNITWCTPEMYISALATAGITDARIIVAAPFEVSGTAALTGMYKAYEDMTGRKLDDLAKLVSTQELTITGELAAEIGSMDTTMIVNELKKILEYTADMSDEELREQIIEIAKRFNVELNDNQMGQLITLCRSLEKLDPDALKARVEELQGTLKKVSDAKTEVVSFVQKAKNVISSISDFFKKIGDLFKK